MSYYKNHNLLKTISKYLIVFSIISVLILPTSFVSSQSISEESENQEKSVNQTELPISAPITSSIIQSSDMEVITTSDRFEGYNLFVLDRHSLGDDHISLVLIVDMDGNIIAEKYIATHANEHYSPAKFINSTTVLYGTLSGATLWNFYTNVTIDLGFRGHHEYEHNPINDTYFTFVRYAIEILSTDYYFDYLREYKQGGEIVWELDTRAFIDRTMWCPYADYININPDISHANTAFYDVDEDIIYLNSRNTNTFYKIDHSTGDVIWGLGEYGDFQLYDKHGNPRSNLFYHAHSVEKIDEDTFIIFDNDYHNQTDLLSEYSRMLEITINEHTMTANVTWDWVGPYGYYSYYWSDADRLPNGNRFGTFGTFDHGGLSSIGARLVEINSDGNIVWEMNFPRSSSYRFGIYRAERFRFSPIISSIPNSWYSTEENVTLDWQTWYNFRNKGVINGSYSLLVDDFEVDSGVVSFESFWNPTNLSFDLGKFSTGQYNITIIVADEAGHTSSETIIINVGVFYLERTGPVDIEQGEGNTLTAWDGFSIAQFWENLTINGTLLQSKWWNGERIELDLDTLSIGVHNITLQLFNGTELVYNDSFWATVYPNTPPEILTNPSDQSTQWNSSLELSWEIFDHSPNYWDILANDVKNDSNTWSSKNFILNWTIPRFDEGIYNITLIVYDRAGNSISSSVMITIPAPSPPVIIYRSSSNEIVWGQANANFIWEVHGGTQSSIFKNGAILSSDTIQSKYISYTINDWYSNLWFPGKYNLTMFVSDEFGNSTSLTVWITVVVHLSDPYADDYVEVLSVYYTNAENSLGAPDGQTASIFSDYGNGYLTLDMGNSEEILNEIGNDFTVVVTSGEYTCWVGNDLAAPFTMLNISDGTTSFDLDSIGFSSARYVRIQYRSGGFVYLDAIEAIHFNLPMVDDEKPSIVGPEDFWIWDNQSFYMLNWEADDLTPFTYSISINHEKVEAGYWDGRDISLTYFWTDDTDLQIVTLTLEDIFGNIALDFVYIQIYKAPDQPLSTGSTSTIFIGAFVGLVTLISISKYWKTKRKQ